MPPVEDDRLDEPVEPVDEAPPGTEGDEVPATPPEPSAAAAAGGDAPPAEAVAPGTSPEPTRPDPKDVDLKLPLAILFGPIVLVWLGVLVAPQIFWDRFVFPYYWGPILADEGFNTINTFTWALLMGAIIFLVWRIVQKIEQPINFAVIAAVLPYMAAGSITRVLEDTGFFVEPLRYFFITPIIYVVIVSVAVFWLIIGHLLAKHTRSEPVNGVTALATFFAIIWVVFTVWSFYGDAIAEFGNPVVLLLCLAVPLVYFWNYTKQTGRLSQVGVMTTFGVAFLLYAIYYVILWHTGQQWENVASDKFVPPAAGSDLRPLVYLALLVFPAVFTGAVYWFAKKKASTANPSLVAFAYLAPVNLLLIHAQMMDATMTALGIDAFGYSEKHVLPAFLIEWVQGFGGTAADYAATIVMLPVKFAVAMLVVWAIDIYAREDVQRYPDLVGLAKLAIIMVGFAPAVRNTVRLAMDV